MDNNDIYNELERFNSELESKKETSREMKNKKVEKKKKKKGGFLFFLSLIVFIVSLVLLGRIIWGYIKSRLQYESIRDAYVIEKDEEEYSYIDFDGLKSMNKEVVAWIRFDSPEIIDYPIMKGTNNEKYLKTSSKGEWSGNGSIFMDYLNMSNFTDLNTIIYGHNMNDGSMFASISKYVRKGREEFYENSKYFYIYLPDDSIRKYEIFSATEIDVSAQKFVYTIFRDGTFTTTYTEWINKCKNISSLNTGVEVSKDDRVVTLSTCTNSSANGRVIVQGKLVEMLREADPDKKIENDLDTNEDGELYQVETGIILK